VCTAVRDCCCCSVSEENQQDKRTSLDNADVHSVAGRHKPSKLSRLSAPLSGSPSTPATGAVSVKSSVKRGTGEAKARGSADTDEGSGRKGGVGGGRACDKSSCVRAGLKPSCFVGATQRLIFMYCF